MLVQMYNEAYRKSVVFENGKKLIYNVVLISIHGIIVAVLLLYRKFHGDLEKIGFEFNYYNSSKY